MCRVCILYGVFGVLAQTLNSLILFFFFFWKSRRISDKTIRLEWIEFSCIFSLRVEIDSAFRGWRFMQILFYRWKMRTYWWRAFWLVRFRSWFSLDWYSWFVRFNKIFFLTTTISFVCCDILSRTVHQVSPLMRRGCRVNAIVWIMLKNKMDYVHVDCGIYGSIFFFRFCFERETRAYKFERDDSFESKIKLISSICLQIASSVLYYAYNVSYSTPLMGDNFQMFFFLFFHFQGKWNEKKEMTYIPLARVSLGERMWIIWVKRYYFFNMINLFCVFSTALMHGKGRKMVHL